MAERLIHIILAVRLPDRPGALGAVASRLGAVRADITDVVIARRGGDALDLFHLDVADLGLLTLIHAELGEVDGVTIERWEQAWCCR
jgi:UTP:GlnB (protein PII) uridylyltransferase